MGVSVQGVAMSKSLLSLLLCGVCLLAGCGGGGTGAFLQSIGVTPINLSVTPGSTQQFNAIGVFSAGPSDSITTKDLTASARWASSNTSVATINAAGLATGVAAGTTTIFASQSGIIGSTTLTVGN